VTLDFYKKMVNKQDETIANSMAQQKEYQKTLRMVERKLGFLRIQFHALIEQVLNFKKGHEGLSIHPTLSAMWKLWINANMNLM
jgi:hypothetical protein